MSLKMLSSIESWRSLWSRAPGIYRGRSLLPSLNTDGWRSLDSDDMDKAGDRQLQLTFKMYIDRWGREVGESLVAVDQVP